MRFEEFEENEQIFDCEQLADKIYIVLSGRVRTLKGISEESQATASVEDKCKDFTSF